MITFQIIFINQILKWKIEWNFKHFIFNQTPLFTAIQWENVEIVKLLLSNDKIDVNCGEILKYILFIQLKIEFFNLILE